MAFRPVARTPAYRQVTEQIRAAIENGDLAPGQMLPTERALSTQFDVSRTTVREALRALQAEGLVRSGQTAPHRTVVTHSTNVVEQAIEALASEGQVGTADLVDLRSCIEVGAMHRGLLGGRPRWNETAAALERMQAAHAITSSASGTAAVDELLAAYSDFHMSVVVASESRLMAMVMRALQLALNAEVRGGLRQLLDEPEHGASLRFVDEHVEILEALQTGDADRAQALLRDHDYAFFFRALFHGTPSRDNAEKASRAEP
jgi:DNA-binding FadR family transcriptional regulator